MAGLWTPLKGRLWSLAVSARDTANSLLLRPLVSYHRHPNLVTKWNGLSDYARQAWDTVKPYLAFPLAGAIFLYYLLAVLIRSRFQAIRLETSSAAVSMLPLPSEPHKPESENESRNSSKSPSPYSKCPPPVTASEHKTPIKTTDRMDLTDCYQDEDHSYKAIDFSLNLYKRLSSSSAFEGTNAAVSPHGIYASLVALVLGARSSSDNNNWVNSVECKLFGHALSTDVLKELVIRFGAVAYDQTRAALTQCNAMFLAKGLRMHAEHSKLLKDLGNISTPTFLWRHDNVNMSSPGTATQINAIVRKATKAQIHDMSVEDLSSETALLMLNAIHLGGPWSASFTGKHTQIDKFYDTDGRRVLGQVPFMMTTKTMSKDQDGIALVDDPELHCQAIQLRHAVSPQVSLVIILPHNNVGSLAEFERSLTTKRLDGLLESLRHAGGRPVTVSIPRFRCETHLTREDLHGLYPQLAGLSLGDLSHMLSFNKNHDHQPQLVSHLQRVIIEVTESSCECSIHGMNGHNGTGSAQSSPPGSPLIEADHSSLANGMDGGQVNLFRADRPFLYFVFLDGSVGHRQDQDHDDTPRPISCLVAGKFIDPSDSNQFFEI